MKKYCAFAAIFLSIFSLSSQNISGVWHNANRLVAFNEEENSVALVLKLFYGWYYDQAAVLNATVNRADNYWEAVFSYPAKKEKNVYPFALADDKLFLDFYIRGSAFATKNQTENHLTAENYNKLYGFWRCGGNTFDLSVSDVRTKTEVSCYFFTDTSVYKIRYWLTDVPISDVLASVVDGDFSFNADKYIQIGGKVYTCVTGRGTSIRNVQKLHYTTDGETLTYSSAPTEKLPLSFSADENLMSFSDPYLVRATITDLSAEIIAMNARRRPPPKPPLPFMKLEFNWEEIKKIRNGLGEFSGELVPLKLFFPHGFSEKIAETP